MAERSILPVSSIDRSVCRGSVQSSILPLLQTISQEVSCKAASHQHRAEHGRDRRYSSAVMEAKGSQLPAPHVHPGSYNRPSSGRYPWPSAPGENLSNIPAPIKHVVPFQAAKSGVSARHIHVHAQYGRGVCTFMSEHTIWSQHAGIYVKHAISP